MTTRLAITNRAQFHRARHVHGDFLCTVLWYGRGYQGDVGRSMSSIWTDAGKVLNRFETVSVVGGLRRPAPESHEYHERRRHEPTNF
jgi:hypothetical protein